MLNKMQGYNEPASVQHNHVQLQVDVALMEQLRAGYAELSARRMGGRRQLLAASVEGESNA
ncbi:MAG TPA: hypothetical protein VIS99_09695 [Terrimicrobiaceae bacterium]